MAEETKEIYYEFGSFRLYPIERVLKCEDAEVKLHNQWFEILLILVRCRQRIVKSDELRKAIWGGSRVEKINLYVTINQLRKALKKADPRAVEYIKTFPRTGFRFMEPVNEHNVPLTVAVIPFKRKGDEKEGDEAGEGGQKTIKEIGYEMADTLTTKLNKNMSILVTPSGTVNREYDEYPTLSPLIFGHRLVVDYVFSGRIWREDGQLHINVDFLNVRANKCDVSSAFEGDYAKSFKLDNLIHKWMESVLELTPTEQEIEQSTKQYTNDPKADESFKNGRLQSFQINKTSLKRAIHHFEQATVYDPNFARAFAKIADAYIFMGMLNLITPQESYYGARDAARNAREKDKTMASAHTTWAFTKMFFEWQWDEAKEGFERAIEINRNYPVAHMGYAHWFTAQGFLKDALREINHAQALDPHSFFISFVRGIILFLFHKYDQSLEQFERTHDLNRRFNLKSDLPYYGSSLAYEYLALGNEVGDREGLFKKADAEARKAITLSNRHPVKLMHRIQLKAIWGKRDDAWNLLDEVLELQRAGHYISQYHLGIVYTSLEEVDLAMECLEKAREDRDQWTFLLGVDPRLDNLRPDQRFKKLLLSIGLKN
jgi:DNA-binding winged helix-turn-helix (wHTH) protein/Tfp pilus assembly protein PilF